MDNLSGVTFDFWSVILLFGFFQGLIFIGTVFIGYPKSKSKFLLLLLVLIITFNLFNYLILHSKLYEQVSQLVHIATPLLMLLGPVYYFYMKSLLYKDLNYKASDVLHFIPFIFIAALFSPFYFMEAGEKITLLNAQIKLGKQSLTPEIYGVLLVQIIHSFCYIFLSVKLLNEAMRGNQIRSLDKKYGWLRKFSYGFLIFWSIDFLAVLWYIVQGEIDKEAYYITMLSCAIIINILVIFAIKNNKIFIQMFLNKNRIKYETSSANTSDLRIYLKEIMDYMEEKVPYLDTEFSLSKLADYLNKPKYLVSQVLNVELGKSFYEFVNEYRFNEVKERLKDPANSNMTISAIAYDSGFHNKNTFNKVFKKQTGMTPSQFMEKYAGID